MSSTTTDLCPRNSKLLAFRSHHFHLRVNAMIFPIGHPRTSLARPRLSDILTNDLYGGWQTSVECFKRNECKTKAARKNIRCPPSDAPGHQRKRCFVPSNRECVEGICHLKPCVKKRGNARSQINQLPQFAQIMAFKDHIYKVNDPMTFAVSHEP